MDPLSTVLSLLKPQSHLTAGFDAGGDWAVAFDDQVGLIKSYAVASGSCLLKVDGVAKPVLLQSGDCFVLPTGRRFILASDLALAPAPADEVYAQPREDGVVIHNGGGGVFLTGARFEVGGKSAAMLLSALPPIIHLERSADQEALRWALDRMQEEVRENEPGASLVAHHLAHMMLIQVLRLYLAGRPNNGVGWFIALADPGIGAAITAMHQRPAHRWTLNELARKAGMSRSIFAQRFRDKVGETPIAYLTRWRMILAIDVLAGGQSVAAAALSVGYESENAFSTAFRRVIGSPPRRYSRKSVGIAAANRDGSGRS